MASEGIADRVRRVFADDLIGEIKARGGKRPQIRHLPVRIKEGVISGVPFDLGRAEDLAEIVNRDRRSRSSAKSRKEFFFSVMQDKDLARRFVLGFRAVVDRVEGADDLIEQVDTDGNAPVPQTEVADYSALVTEGPVLPGADRENNRQLFRRR